ncbi:MAG: hypothetical protein H7X97_05980 [Opitutaceae bacterium]|nr:hypothetical protein [Verrucomicrobiales bacterium]
MSTMRGRIKLGGATTLAASSSRSKSQSLSSGGDSGYITRANTFDEPEGNFSLAFVGGLFASLAGAAMWGVVSVTVSRDSGWMAMFVGLVVGLVVRSCGKGMQSFFSMTGAFMAVVGCLAGNLLALSIVQANLSKLPLLDYLKKIDLATAVQMLRADFGRSDWIFYGVAIVIAYHLSAKKPSVP